MSNKIEPLSVYVIYYNPSDYIGMYVLRRQQIVAGEIHIDKKPMCVSKHMGDIRAALPVGLIEISTANEPDRCIEEIWL